jgi:Tol biopolymer transport system component
MKIDDLNSSVFSKNTHSIHSDNSDIKLFKNFQFNKKITLPKEKPTIYKILSSIIDPEIYIIHVFPTAKGVSFEDKYLTGKKLSLLIKVKEKILYVADDENQSVHALESVSYIYQNIIVPEKIEGSLPEILVKNQFLIPNVATNYLSVKNINSNTIVEFLHLHLSIEIVPTYSLCYTKHTSSNSSNIFVIFKNGLRKRQLTFDESKKCMLAKWSPCGRKIAYISNKEGSNQLFISTLSGYIKSVPLPNTINQVVNFCWSKHSSNIYLSATSFGTEELYNINIFTQKCERLTFSDFNYSNIDPKYHTVENKIIFKRVNNNCCDLYSITPQGLDLRQLTDFGTIKYFDCCNSYSTLVYIAEKKHIDNCENNIYLFDFKRYTSSCIFKSSYFIIKKVKFSLDGQYIAFILWDYDFYNIYFYDLKKNTFYNSTNFNSENKIYDLQWAPNSETLYFSMLRSNKCNIFSLSLANGFLSQITNEDAVKIEFSYRPKIS